MLGERTHVVIKKYCEPINRINFQMNDQSFAKLKGIEVDFEHSRTHI